ncbi:hypothetical protein [Micromonospora sp. NPDC005324]|uniref:hypothetical protein n=1 Tax=Micromonospora sp. NPDC005324 TaxID=3157033 RepID=UPI0033AC1C9C
MSVHDLVLDLDTDVDFTYALETYLIYPWVRDGDELVRPLRVGPKDAHHAVARIRQSAPNQLTAQVTVDDAVPDGIDQVHATLVRCLQLDYPYEQIVALASGDPVLQAAVNHRGLGRGKLYPDVFEALCGAMSGQRALPMPCVTANYNAPRVHPAGHARRVHAGQARNWMTCRNTATFGSPPSDEQGHPD